jgi:hypothetical protein
MQLKEDIKGAMLISAMASFWAARPIFAFSELV